MNRFQAKHRILVASVASYKKPPHSSRWLIKSCQHFDIDLTLLGKNLPYPNHRQKARLLAEFLRDNPGYDYVLEVDFKDVIFCATIQEMFSKYLSFGHAVVAASERISWPVPSHRWRSPEVGTSFRYLNAGTIFATTAAWRDAWDCMEEKYRRSNGIPEEQSNNGTHMFNCDQGAWSDLYVNRDVDIVLDKDCKLFQPLVITDCDVAAANQDYIFEGRRIINRETGERPCLIHGNGNLPIDPWGQYILHPSTTWIWPLIEQIRRAPLSRLQDEESLTELICLLGLHQSLSETCEDRFLQFTCKGLEIHRHPQQFARHLLQLAQRPAVRTYQEVGISSGGAFIATVEYLRRFHPLRAAIGIAPRPSMALLDYVQRTEGVYFLDTEPNSPRHRSLLDRLGNIDVVVEN